MSIQSPAKCEIRSVIRYLVWKGKTPVEVYNEVKTAYGDKGMNRTSVFKWCREFKNGRTSVHDDQRSGRPSILTDDIVEKILLLCIWWDQQGVILSTSIDAFESSLKKKTAAIHDKVILLHDNARPYVAKPVKTYLGTLKWEVLPHPLYSPDIAPSDFHLFRSMAHGLADRRFHSYEEAQKWIDSWIASKDMSFFRRGIHVPPERWEKVVSSDGQYFK
ncbi:MOS1T transposase, partial [Pseudoatta argentina]